MINKTFSSTLLGKFWFIVLAGLGGVLIWLVVTRSFVAYYAKSAPETALILRSNDGEALVNIADRVINQIKGTGDSISKQGNAVEKFDPQQIQGWIKQAILDKPLNPRALRILGQISVGHKDKNKPGLYMQAALDASIRESVAAYWLMQKSYQEKNYSQALYYAKILLWYRPQLVKNIMPMLAFIAENKREQVKLETLLAQNPKWRSRFFSALPYAITDARTPLNLLLYLKKTSFPPTQTEVLGYINFLNRVKLYSLSYYSWLQFLPPKQLSKVGLLFNGGFEMPLDQMPFNWSIKKGRGAIIDIVPSRNNPDKKVLNIELSRGHSNLGGISQMVILSPGNYVLEGRHKGQLIGQRGLRWRITCLNKRSPQIGQGSMFIGTKRSWQNFRIAFTVPPKNCNAQRISLILDARTRSEKLASGSIWYDSLKVTPKFEG